MTGLALVKFLNGVKMFQGTDLVSVVLLAVCGVWLVGHEEGSSASRWKLSGNHSLNHVYFMELSQTLSTLTACERTDVEHPPGTVVLQARSLITERDENLLRYEV